MHYWSLNKGTSFQILLGRGKDLSLDIVYPVDILSRFYVHLERTSFQKLIFFLKTFITYLHAIINMLLKTNNFQLTIRKQQRRQQKSDND